MHFYLLVFSFCHHNVSPQGFIYTYIFVYANLFGKRFVNSSNLPNSFRVLRVPEVIITELEKRKCQIDMYKEKMQEAFIDNDYISCQANGKVHSLSAMNNALTKLCVRNGLPAVTMHGLRHMFATILVEQGVPLAKISGLLGHSSVNTTFEYYCDVMDEKEKIIAFMNDAFIPEGREGTG